MPGAGKVRNEYQEALGDLYDSTPKAVLGAIAVSFATEGGDKLSEARALVLEEWRILHMNGIVPQKPPSA
jgi:hypothetical protein